MTTVLTQRPRRHCSTVLAEQHVSATFFVIPRHINELTAPIVTRMFEEGHGVALHAHTRTLMLRQPDELARLLAEQASDLERLTGWTPCRLFRPHAGWRGGEMYQGLDRAGYTLAGWSFGMWDWNWWRPARPGQLVQRLAERASDGDIVVMHDGHHENPRADRQQTVDDVRAGSCHCSSGGASGVGSLCTALSS